MERPNFMHMLARPLAAGAIALFATGCSEAVPPASEGAATVLWQGSGATCAVKTVETSTIGKVDADEYIELKKDTVAGAKITCRVTGGGSYSVEADLQFGGTTLAVKVDGVSPQATVDSPASGYVAFSALYTAGSVYTSPSEQRCNFWLAPGQEIAAGRAWMQFGCPELVDGSVGSTCGIQNDSTIAVQNCDQ
jgi:hypothetical protein